MEVQFGPTTANNRVDSPTAAAESRYQNHYELHHHHHTHHHNNHHNNHLNNHPNNHHQQYYRHNLLPHPGPIQQDSHYGHDSSSSKTRKRKAGSRDNNERLSKRLSLLNLEKSGQKLYVPVESTSLQPLPEHPGYNNPPTQSSSASASSSSTPNVAGDDCMQLDNTKHKVYIYDLDAELSSADESSDCEFAPGSPTSGNSRLVFLPDIEKHLRRSRIPSAVFANVDGELAGHSISDMQVVLYSEPSSLTVAPEHDSVRKAVLEARARARQKQIGDRPETVRPDAGTPVNPSPPTTALARNRPSWHDPLAADDNNDDNDGVDDVDAMDMD
ncbi:hypothetical protein SAMD00023353_1201750 [Rosellinia necatrix]|uniref:Uncharacterized protein n=1 Tax=Rosellinia necatrix TaxID=77044 RepID=A0A1W2TKG9_ROSNE|nr:hypothetical protein SAMD00023353_1201750 [Rosellinia necatrix]